MHQNCKICKSTTNFIKVITRSKSKKKLYYCKKCDYEFFNHSPNKNLERNKLDKTRLQKAGLKVPTRNQEFLNGFVQSNDYFKRYLRRNKKKLNILDIGCSWGYFLYLIKEKGHNPYGLELNKIKRNFVENKLKIICKSDISYYEINNIKFDVIFLFYSLEYISNPLIYIKNLIKSLSNKGKIIIITPNKNDILNNILKENSYSSFFYDENSINYFSYLALKRIAEFNKIKNYKISFKQGYSLVNFLNWYNFKKPFFTGYVGEDRFIEDIIKKLNFNKIKNKKYSIIRSKIINILKDSNSYFKELAIQGKLANILIFKIYNN